MASDEYELGAHTRISVWFNSFRGKRFTITAGDNTNRDGKPIPSHAVIEIEGNYGKPSVALHLSDDQLNTLHDVIGKRLEWLAVRCPECLTVAASERGVPCEPCQAKLADGQREYEAP